MTELTHATRSIEIVHGEAFQLMLYRADDGEEVWFWNSRDGVTPFGTLVNGKEFRHAMHDYPIRYIATLPDKAEYIWVSHTRETWAAMQRQKFDHFTSREGEYGDHFKENYPTLEAWLQVSPFEHGQPHQMTRDEFLATTPEWIGALQ